MNGELGFFSLGVGDVDRARSRQSFLYKTCATSGRTLGLATTEGEAMSDMSGNASIYPNLLYADADKAIAWLERTLGFECGDVHRDEGGAIQHAELSLGSGVVMVGTAGTGREPFKSLRAGGALVYCAVDDIDGLYARARESGAEIALELIDTDYGSRDFTVRDPEGTLWALGTYRPEAAQA